jgi:hypothetical protein
MNSRLSKTLRESNFQSRYFGINRWDSSFSDPGKLDNADRIVDIGTIRDRSVSEATTSTEFLKSLPIQISQFQIAPKQE